MSGYLVRKMTPALTNERRGARLANPGQGARVRLWQLEGLWAVWCDGPERGTRWLIPHDDTARELLTVIGGEPSTASPVVSRVFAGAGGVPRAVLVKCSEIRDGLRFIGEA